MQPAAAGGYSTVDPRSAEAMDILASRAVPVAVPPVGSGAAPSKRVKIWPIIKESLQGSALSALLLGLALRHYYPTGERL
jgi:hypothetical protein